MLEKLTYQWFVHCPSKVDVDLPFIEGRKAKQDKAKQDKLTFFKKFTISMIDGG